MRSNTVDLRYHLGSYYENRATGDTITIVDHEGSHKRASLIESVYSESHPGWKKLRGSSQDLGGPFFLERNRVNFLGFESFERKQDIGGGYNIVSFAEGVPLPCSLSDLEFPHSIASDNHQMNLWGAEAVAKAAPGTSPMNLAVALGELKHDGLPAIVGATLKDRSSVVKKAGDEYLNAQFGWKPLINDVKSLADTVTHGGDILHQLEKDAGKVVRRRVTVLEEEERDSIDMGYQARTLSGTGSSFIDTKLLPGNVRRLERKYRKVWFSGSFTYYLPPDYYSRNAVIRAAARAKVLYGLKLNPETLWNLAPWSWAADWFSNAGEVITNTQRFLTEGLVMHHGYLMEHSVHEYTYVAENNNVTPITFLTENKGRVKANPFGFGLDFSALSGFQVSILGALGMSRSG